MRPSLGAMKPVMMANSVVLPAPLGPISAVMQPASAVNDARLTASRPPKRRETFSTRSSSAMAPLRSAEVATHAGEQSRDAARRKRHDQHQHGAINNQIEPRRMTGDQLGQLAERTHHQRAEQRAE